jgi:hypothetical protein
VQPLRIRATRESLRWDSAGIKSQERTPETRAVIFGRRHSQWSRTAYLFDVSRVQRRPKLPLCVHLCAHPQCVDFRGVRSVNHQPRHDCQASPETGQSRQASTAELASQFAGNGRGGGQSVTSYGRAKHTGRFCRIPALGGPEQSLRLAGTVSGAGYRRRMWQGEVVSATSFTKRAGAPLAALELRCADGTERLREDVLPVVELRWRAPL